MVTEIAPQCITTLATLQASLFQAPLFPWGSPGGNTGVAAMLSLQEVFLTQRLALHLLGLPHIGRWVLFHQHQSGSHPVQYNLENKMSIKMRKVKYRASLSTDIIIIYRLKGLSWLEERTELLGDRGVNRLMSHK